MLNKKRIISFAILSLLAIILLVGFSSLISAQSLFCAEKTLSGAWCQNVPENEVDKNGFKFAPQACETTDFCKLGTCVNENSGTCSKNTPKAKCEKDGGVWSNKDKEDIIECRPGCCILGQGVAFVNQATCKSLASTYGVNVNFREDINTFSQCLAQDTTPDEGACVLEESATTTSGGNFFSNLFGGGNQETITQTSAGCKRTTQSGCAALDGEFNKDLLCTAKIENEDGEFEFLSDCAKDSTKTIIENDKVYYVDTCGNKANIYDDSRFNEIGYWTEIQDPTCSVGVSTSSSTCGDCSYRLGTVAAEYTKETNMPSSSPKYGDNVCRDLSCDYKGEPYKHGESWCAETPGTYSNVPFFMDSTTKKEIAEGYDDYNLPGSRYVKLSCYDGKTTVEKCKTGRNSICMGATDPNTNEREADCIDNLAPGCSSLLTNNSCEGNRFCKWVPGYAPGMSFLGYGLEEGLEEAGIDITEYKTNKEKYDTLQGTCMPLFPQGNKFWNSSGEEYCSGLSITEKVLFETGTLEQRKNFAEDSIKEAANKCIDNCWAIPGYGSDTDGKYTDLETLKDFQLGTGSLGTKVQNAYFSKREGYYCKKKAEEPDVVDNWKSGAEKGSEINCGGGADSKERRIKPFYTHEQWLKTISERTRSSGDCGYKPHAYKDLTKWEGDTNSEKITVSFQILKQDKKEKKLVGEKKTLYTGKEINLRTPLNVGYRK